MSNTGPESTVPSAAPGDGGAGLRPAGASAGEGRAHRKPPVPVRYWVLWWVTLVVADVVFYVLLTPIWIGLRTAAWLAEFRARRRR